MRAIKEVENLQRFLDMIITAGHNKKRMNRSTNHQDNI